MRSLRLTLVDRGAEFWSDCSDVDVVLGLRSFGRVKFDTKPPTKLINTWLAVALFIRGRDPAYL